MPAPAATFRTPVLIGLLAMWVLTTLLAPASAHVNVTTGSSTLTLDDAEIRQELRLDYEVFVRAAGMGLAALEADSTEERVRAVRERDDVVLDYLTERVIVFADGVACEPVWGAPATVAASDARPQIVLDLRHECHAVAPTAVTMEYTVFRATDGVVDDHRLLLDYRLGEKSGRAVMDRAHTTFRSGDASPWAVAGQFIALGFHHILAGLDHILFVAALVLGATRVRDLLWAVTTFTVAHSITLGLAALQWLLLPPTIVEPLIALSIAFVALDGLLHRTATRHRLVAVFAFGLLHGLGFAGALQMEGGSAGSFLWSLLTFNVGIELGQVLIIALVLPVLFLLRRRFPRIAVPAITAGAVAVACMGLFWFAERVWFTPALTS